MMWNQETAVSHAVSKVTNEFATLRTMIDLAVPTVESGEKDALTILQAFQHMIGRMQPAQTTLTESWKALQEVINGMGIAEATNLSGLSRQTIYTLIRNQSVEAQKMPSGQIVIDRESLESYLQRRRRRAEPVT